MAVFNALTSTVGSGAEPTLQDVSNKAAVNMMIIICRVVFLKDMIGTSKSNGSMCYRYYMPIINRHITIILQRNSRMKNTFLRCGGWRFSGCRGCSRGKGCS